MPENISQRPTGLQTITLAAPGFWGLNTQDSPLDLDARFASDANNCVIDKKGRMAARKGTELVSTNGAAVLGSGVGIEFVDEFIAEDGTKTLFSAGGLGVFTGTTTLVDETPAGATITANKWQSATLSNKFYMFQSGHTPLVFTAGADLTRVQDEGAYTGTVPQANAVVAAFGRLFVANDVAEKSTITWCDLLNGLAWDGGSSGSINLRKHWPSGYDQIEGLAAHNNFLVVFGKKNILIFSGADSPSTMSLHDTISNIGCVARDTIQSDGKEIFYLSASGLRTLGRTIQEKSSPIGDASKNVNDDVKSTYKAETGSIKGHYNQDEGFYILSFQHGVTSYVFDTRYPLEDGSLRATTWNSLVPLSMTRTDAGSLYIGTSGGVEVYSGYLDRAASTYDLAWATHPLSFGVPGNIKFLKGINVTLDGGSGYQSIVRWAWDYQTQYTTDTITLAVNNVGEYGIAEYGIAEYSASIAISNEATPASGSGKVLTSGLVTTINDKPFSIQQFEVKATIGRVA
jgi:hypothetical protein